jgi:hypothetical protein
MLTIIALCCCYLPPSLTICGGPSVIFSSSSTGPNGGSGLPDALPEPGQSSSSSSSPTRPSSSTRSRSQPSPSSSAISSSALSSSPAISSSLSSSQGITSYSSHATSSSSSKSITSSPASSSNVVINANLNGLLPSNTEAENDAALQAIAALAAQHQTSTVDVSLPGTYNISSSKAYSFNFTSPNQTAVFNGGGATFLLTSNGSSSDPFGVSFAMAGRAGQGHSGVLANFSVQCVYPGYAQGYYAGTNGSGVSLFLLDAGAPPPSASQQVYQLTVFDVAQTVVVDIIVLDQPVNVVLAASGGLPAYAISTTTDLSSLATGQPVALKYSLSDGAPLISASNLDSFGLSSVGIFCSYYQPFMLSFLGNVWMSQINQTRAPGRWISSIKGGIVQSPRGNLTLVDSTLAWGNDDCINIVHHVMIPMNPLGVNSQTPVVASNSTSITFTALSLLHVAADYTAVPYNTFYVRNTQGAYLTTASNVFATYTATMYSVLGQTAPFSLDGKSTFVNVTLTGSAATIALLPITGAFNYWTIERAVPNFVSILNNTLGPNRGHGLVMSTTQPSLVHGNNFLNNHEGAIQNAYFLSFGQGPQPMNMVIDGNYFLYNSTIVSNSGSANGLILFQSQPANVHGETSQPLVPGGMYNLTITNNVLVYLAASPTGVIVASGVAGLLVANNTVYLAPPYGGVAAVTATDCSGVTTYGNEVSTTPPPLPPPSGTLPLYSGGNGVNSSYLDEYSSDVYDLSAQPINGTSFRVSWAPQASLEYCLLWLDGELVANTTTGSAFVTGLAPCQSFVLELQCVTYEYYYDELTISPPLALNTPCATPLSLTLALMADNIYNVVWANNTSLSMDVGTVNGQYSYAVGSLVTLNPSLSFSGSQSMYITGNPGLICPITAAVMCSVAMYFPCNASSANLQLAAPDTSNLDPGFLFSYQGNGILTTCNAAYHIFVAGMSSPWQIHGTRSGNGIVQQWWMGISNTPAPSSSGTISPTSSSPTSSSSATSSSLASSPTSSLAPAPSSSGTISPTSSSPTSSSSATSSSLASSPTSSLAPSSTASVPVPVNTTMTLTTTPIYISQPYYLVSGANTTMCLHLPNSTTSNLTVVPCVYNDSLYNTTLMEWILYPDGRLNVYGQASPWYSMYAPSPCTIGSGVIGSSGTRKDFTPNNSTAFNYTLGTLMSRAAACAPELCVTWLGNVTMQTCVAQPYGPQMWYLGY